MSIPRCLGCESKERNEKRAFYFLLINIFLFPGIGIGLGLYLKNVHSIDLQGAEAAFGFVMAILIPIIWTVEIRKKTPIQVNKDIKTHPAVSAWIDQGWNLGKKDV